MDHLNRRVHKTGLGWFALAAVLTFPLGVSVVQLPKVAGLSNQYLLVGIVSIVGWAATSALCVVGGILRRKSTR